ncbi:MAG TPA: oligosaccharide flippase family protein [Anaerolineaceae bacterium]|nr:oligosaccharide flippase family protein [Anaerolineaceae bacterium]HPN52454.1 oligosaccharide flippase family protein [Anaerolineaceae bacterium]
MPILLTRLKSWTQDRLLRRVLRHSTYLIASNIISALLSIVTADLLGAGGLGALDVVIRFASNINRLLSFRMGEVVVKYMGEAVARGETERAAAVVKLAMGVESLTSLLTYAVLALFSPWAAENLAHDAALTPYFLIYGLFILGNLASETANGILQVGNHYRSQALANFIQSLVTAALIVLAWANGWGLMPVLLAYLLGKLILGISPMMMAFYWLPRMIGPGWWRAPLSALPARREMLRFALSTNASGTVNVLARDSETLWVSAFFGTAAAGYFKVALAIINLVVMPITPFITTTYPEITRNIARGEWPHLRRLLRRVTIISAAWSGGVALGLLVLGQPVLFSTWNLLGRSFHVYKAEYLPAYPLLLILLVGYSAANILFWNRSLLLGFNQPNYALWVALSCMIVKTLLTLLLVPQTGIWMEALLLDAYFIVSVGLITWRGLGLLNQAEKKGSAA